MKKNNNKGFSLVELIVVVLIMGIIAVALAPQVMKWVGTSKESTDASNKDALRSSAQTALADWQQAHILPGTGKNYKATISAGAITEDSANDAAWGGYKTCLDEVTGTDYPTGKACTNFVLTIDGQTGKVSVTTN